MAFRTWAKLLGANLGVGTVAGASQLGVAYGLGILRFTRAMDVTVRDHWVAELAWVAWLTMASAAIAGLVGRRLLPVRSGAGTRVVAAVTSGLGAAVTVPLTMQPARTAQIEGVHAVFVITVCATLGATAGVLAAYAALSRAVARWSLTTVGAAVWLVAIASVAPSLDPSAPLPDVRLGVFDARFLPDPLTHRTALLTMPLLALVCGVATGWVARRRELSMLSIALSGLAGPALLTVAYLIAGPGGGPQRYEVVPYWAAMTAAGAGVLGSVLVAVVGRGATADSVAYRPGGQPTPNRPPLPRRDTQPTSAIAEAATRPAEQPHLPAKATAEVPGATSAASGFHGFTAPQGRSIPGQPIPGRPVPGRPQLRPMNAPPSSPEPVTPRLPVTPASGGRAGDGQVYQPQGGRRQSKEGEFVDWVSGLGNG